MAFGFEALDHVDATHPGHQRVDQKASFASRAIGFEEGWAIGEKFHRIPVLLKQIAHGLAYGAIVVDDKYGGQR